MENINVTCKHCNQITVIKANTNDIMKWQDGMLIQNALPYLSNNERELLISALCPKCWDELFADDETTDNLDDIIY